MISTKAPMMRNQLCEALIQRYAR